MADQDDDLTVEDILSAAQNEGVAEADGAAAPDAAASDATASDETGSDADGAEPNAEGTDPHLEDLRRLTAEYANYRKRTEANAELERQRVTAAVMVQMLPVLDDLDRAEQHGDLVEGSAFTTIAQKLRAIAERMGLEAYGEANEPFDPQVHEAIAQVPVPGTEQPVILEVIERGYRLGDVELRPAKVAVAVGVDG